MKRFVLLLLALSLTAIACVAEPDAVEDAAPEVRSESGVLPIDTGEMQLATSLCEAASDLVAAEAAFIERSFGDFDHSDAAVTEWEFRLYGLRFAAQFDAAVSDADSGLIQTTTLIMGRIDQRPGYINFLPPTDDLSTAASDLREVMLRLCPTVWEAEISTRVISGG